MKAFNKKRKRKHLTKGRWWRHILNFRIIKNRDTSNITDEYDHSSYHVGNCNYKAMAKE